MRGPNLEIDHFQVIGSCSEAGRQAIVNRLLERNVAMTAKPPLPLACAVAEPEACLSNGNVYTELHDLHLWCTHLEAFRDHVYMAFDEWDYLAIQNCLKLPIVVSQFHDIPCSCPEHKSRGRRPKVPGPRQIGRTYLKLVECIEKLKLDIPYLPDFFQELDRVVISTGAESKLLHDEVTE
jgi:hypothetical protein